MCRLLGLKNTVCYNKPKLLLLVLGICLATYFIGYRYTCMPIIGKLKMDINNAGPKAIKSFEEITPLMHQTMCALMPRWESNMITPKTPTDWTKWDFTTTVSCPRFSLDYIPTERQKISLDCKNDASPRMVMSVTNSTADIDHVQFGDACLNTIIEKCCTDDNHVPNVVHYVWYKYKELSIFNFISFMSSLRFMKPCLILIHGDSVPYGIYWDYFVSISPNIILVNRTRPTHIFGHKLAFEEHSSDVMRVEALQAYGGVYLDTDEILLRPLEPLRKYEHTMAYEIENSMAASLIMSRKNATFLNYWYDSYRNDYQPNWGHNPLHVPALLAKKYPELIHVSGFNFTRPGCLEIEKLFVGNYNWSINYAIHLYLRGYRGHITIQNIRTLNSTLGAVCRHVLFGNKEMCIK